MWKDDNAKPIWAKDDCMVRVGPGDGRGVCCGKKHFRSGDEAEAYALLLDINGFSRADL